MQQCHSCISERDQPDGEEVKVTISLIKLLSSSLARWLKHLKCKTHHDKCYRKDMECLRSSYFKHTIHTVYIRYSIHTYICVYMLRASCCAILTALNSINSTATRIIHHLLPWLRTTSTSFFFPLFSTLRLGGARLSDHWCGSAVLPELLLKWQGVLLVWEV